MHAHMGRCLVCMCAYPQRQELSFSLAAVEDDEDVDEVAVLTQALSSALCTHAEMLLQKAVAERDLAAGVSILDMMLR